MIARRFLLGLVVGSLSLAALVVPAHAQINIATVPVQNDPFYLTANAATNTVYVANLCGTDPNCGTSSPGTVTVINGATNMVTTTITVGVRATFVVANPVTNKVYVTNRRDNTVSVIDGATNTVIKTIGVGSHPTVEDVNPITNKIYVVNNGNGQGTTMSVIDGNTDTVVATVTVGNYPQAVSVDAVRNKAYVVNYCGNQFGCNATPAPGTVSVVDGATNTVTHTVTVGYGAALVFVNAVTNKIWVGNSCGADPNCDISGDDSQVIGSVTQIDGASFATQTVNTGKGFTAFANNSVANAVYVTNTTDNTLSIVDGSNLSVSTVNVGASPSDVEVNPATDTIFVCNSGAGTVTAVNGATMTTTTVNVGNMPVEAWVNPVVNRVYVSNVGDNTVSVLAGVAPNAIQFINTTPCRLVDTRPPNGNGPIQGGTSENFLVPGLGGCGIPSNATAYSLNVTVVPLTPLGYLTIWPTGLSQPFVSTLNSPDGRIKANAAIVPAGYQGGVSVYVTNTTNVIIDIDGYFAPPSGQTYQFFPLTPCRVVDTRTGSQQPQGLGPPSLANMETRDLPILSSPCLSGITNAKAYSLNATVVASPAGQRLNFLTLWPSDQDQPTVSTLNNPTATVVANGAIVPAAANGNIKAFAFNSTDLILDINGYFAPAGPGGASFYPAVPCRVFDTRGIGSGQPFRHVLTPPVDIVDSACAPPSNATGYVLNATVVPTNGPMGFLTLWPDGTMQPTVSTLNAYDGFVTSNVAVVPNVNGSIDAYADGFTQLILDLSGYFAP